MSKTETSGVLISVSPVYLPERSDPSRGIWFHIYHVSIENRSPHTVQLLSRHWIITDGEGHVEHVKGPGVVGEQPVLKQGESFRYTSGCPLGTPFGTMHGSYQMKREDGQVFDAEISPFTLAEPWAVN